MAQYKGKPAVVPMTADEIVSKFADLTAMQDRLAQLPQEQRDKLGDISFTNDTISLQTPQVGTISFRRTELSPSAIGFQAVGTPIPLQLKAELRPAQGGSATEVTTVIDVDVPMMLKPMLSGPLQKAADQFGEMLGKLL